MDRSITSLAFLTAVLAFATARAENGTDKLPTEYFAKYDEFGRVRLSPDGETIAVATAKKRTATLSMIGLRDGKVYGTLVNNQHEFGDFDWASNTRLVYTLSEYSAQTTIPKNKGEILALDRDMSNHAMIYGFRAGNSKSAAGNIKVLQPSNKAIPTIVDMLRNDDDKVLLAEQRWREDSDWFRFDPDVKANLSWMNVRSGVKQDLGGVPVGGTDILLDKNEQPRVAYGVDASAHPVLAWKPTTGDAWKIVTLPGLNAASLRPRLFADDDESLFVTAGTEREPLVGLYRVNLSTLTIEKLFQFDITDIEDVVFDFQHRKIVGVVADSITPQYHWLDESDPVATMFASLRRTFPTLFVTLNSASPDGSKAIVTLWSDIHPGQVYLYETQTSKLTSLYALRSWIDPKQMRAKEPIVFKTRDGLQLHGYLTRSAGTAPYRLVVMPHDGPHTRDFFRFDPQVQFLANRGYAVLQVNFRGSTGYGSGFESASAHEWGAKIQDDITDAAKWAIEQKLSTPVRTCIYGVNFGAYVALMSAIREPSLYKCAIGEAGIYDLELLYSKSEPHNIRSEHAALEAEIGKDKEELRARSPVSNAVRLQIPVLLLYGKETWRPDLEHTKRMKAALEKTKKPFESEVMSRETLFMYDDEARREVFERVLTFLDKQLGR